jgi:coenzyme F420-reducing hydrogenase beta subunit
MIMQVLKQMFSDHTFLFFFAVVGIPCIIGGITGIVKQMIKHRERMAMIEHGMDPYASERTKSRKREVVEAASPEIK